MSIMIRALRGMLKRRRGAAVPLSPRAAGLGRGHHFVGTPNYFVGNTFVIFTPTVYRLKRNYFKNLFRSFLVILTDTYRTTRGSTGPLR